MTSTDRIGTYSAVQIRNALFVFFFLGLLATGWVHDDAFISFRTVENFVEGRGLTWNPGERVQVFTHPLWFFLHSAAFFVTREIYFTTFALCFACSLLALYLMAYRIADSARMGALVIAVLLLSQGFLDYSTSGLETPLTHLLIVLIAWKAWDRDGGSGNLLAMAALTCAAALNRLDLLALLMPGFVLLWLRADRRSRTLGLAILVLPLMAWEAFSLVYFGFLVPNTAPAKLATGVSHLGKLLQGGYYFASALVHDAFTLLFGAWCFRQSWRFGSLQARAAVMGVGLHIAYIFWIGGDYMSGRFLSAPLLVLMLAWLSVPRSDRSLPRFRPWVVVAVIALAIRTVASLSSYGVDAVGIGDERRVWHPFTGLVYAVFQDPWPESRWKLAPGEDCDLEFCIVAENDIGLFGYYSGPDVYILDSVALGDAFRARLPGKIDGQFNLPGKLAWRPGHVTRPIPAGLLESLRTKTNRIEDPELARFYDAITLATRGPLWSRERWVEIWKLNTHAYGSLEVGAEDPKPVLSTPPGAMRSR